MTNPIAIIKIRKEPVYRRDAFEAGLKRVGYTVLLDAKPIPHPRGPDDLLVLWNKKRGADEDAADLWEYRGGTVIVTENAYLQKVDKSAYAISTHGHNGSGWFPVWDEDRFKVLGFPIMPWRIFPEGYGIWLVCGQRGVGSSLMSSPPQWGEKMLKQLEAKRKTVKLRGHPGNNFAPKVTLADDLFSTSRCIIWSSAAGVRALLEGIPVEHHAPHWICASSGGTDDRVEKLNFMAHGQWSVAEIAIGEPFARMKAENWGPRTW